MKALNVLLLVTCALLFLSSCDDGEKSSNESSLVYFDIPYKAISGADQNQLSLDIYLPARVGGDNLPVVIYVHGGHWNRGDKRGDKIRQNVKLKAKAFNAAGYIFVSANHRLSPNPVSYDPDRIMFPDHLRDIAGAIAFVQKNIHWFSGDNERIGLLGWSSGGHLTSLVSTDESFLNEVGLPLSTIQCNASLNSAALDIPAILDTSPESRIVKYFNALGDSLDVWIKASPITHVEPGKNIPAFLLVHGDAEDINKVQASFYDALNQAGVFVDAYHAIGFSHRQTNWMIGIDERLTDTVLDFFDDCLTR